MPTIAANTVAEYLDSRVCATKTTDAKATYGLTQVGTVPYGAQGQPAGDSAAGAFSGANYFTAPQALCTAMNVTPNAWSVECDVYVTSLATFNCIVGVNNASSLFLGLDAGTGTMRKDLGGTILSGTTGISVNTWTHIAWTWDGTNTRMYINGALDRQAASNAAWPAATGAINIGIWAAALPWVGYLNRLRFSNAVLSAFPTTDIFGTSSGSMFFRRRRGR